MNTRILSPETVRMVVPVAELGRNGRQTGSKETEKRCPKHLRGGPPNGSAKWAVSPSSAEFRREGTPLCPTKPPLSFLSAGKTFLPHVPSALEKASQS